MAHNNMPLASPPKRTRLDIFGSSDSSSALKASSWHAGTQSLRLCDEIEEMHGRQAFREDCAMGQCLAGVGSMGAAPDSRRENASGTSPLRRKVSKGEQGVKPYERDKPEGCVFEMDMAEESECSAASAPANAATGTESRGPACEQGSSAQMEGAVFAMDEELAASAKGTSPPPNPGSDSGDLSMAQDEQPKAEASRGGSLQAGGRVAASSTSEAEASALAVLHAMASGTIVPPQGDAVKASTGQRMQLGNGSAASGSGGSLQLPVLVKSDGTTMVVSEDILNKMGIPLVPPTAAAANGLPAVPALAFPIESPATKAASGFQGMSLDTPTGARAGDNASGGNASSGASAGAPATSVGMSTTCDAVLTAIGVLTPVTSVQARGLPPAPSGVVQHERTDMYKKAGSSQMVAALAESISGAGGACNGGRQGIIGQRDEELSTADEAAIAALQELGAAGGRWGKDGGGRGGRGDASASGTAGGGSINSRHGAARGRQVTRSCPGCSERISIACKFCTLCGYTFRRSSTNASQSQPSTPREAMMSPPRAADGAMPASGADGTGGEGVVDGGKTLGALLKKGRQAEGMDGSPVSAAAAAGDKASKMTTPTKADGNGALDANGPESRMVKKESADAEGAGASSLESDKGGGGGGAQAPRQTVTRVTANSLELHKIKEQARRAREKQLLARLQSLLFDSRECQPAPSGASAHASLTPLSPNAFLTRWSQSALTYPSCSTRVLPYLPLVFHSCAPLPTHNRLTRWLAILSFIFIYDPKPSRGCAIRHGHESATLSLHAHMACA